MSKTTGKRVGLFAQLPKKTVIEIRRRAKQQKCAQWSIIANAIAGTRR